MKSKDEQIHELEQQVSDMAMEITRLRNAMQRVLDNNIKLLGILSQEAAQNHQSNLTLPDH